jgi:hypothetical protein
MSLISWTLRSGSEQEHGGVFVLMLPFIQKSSKRQEVKFQKAI